MRESRPAARAAGTGFTLIELLVVLAIIGLIAIVGLTSLGGVRRAKLQDQAFEISRYSRNALIWALSRATTVRMVVDLDGFRLWLEAARGTALVDESGSMVELDGGEEDDAYYGTGTGEPGEDELLSLGEGEEGYLPEDDEGSFGGFLGDMGGLFGDESALAALEEPPVYRPPAFSPISEPRMMPIALEGLQAMRVYLPGSEEPITEGRAYVFYRDDGTADAAVLHIENDTGEVYAIAIQPLTGRGALYPYPYVPEPPEILP